jgi:hypothetical protein
MGENNTPLERLWEEFCDDFFRPVARLIDEAPHADVHDDAESEEGEQNRGAAIAEQRQRYPCDKHEADDHAYVDGDLEHDDPDDTHDDEANGVTDASAGEDSGERGDSRVTSVSSIRPLPR